MYEKKINQDMPQVFKDAADALLKYFAKRGDKNIQNYLDKINSCKYFIIPENIDGDTIEIEITEGKDLYIVRKKLLEDVVGEYFAIVYEVRNIVKKEDIIFLNYKETRIKDKILKDKFLVESAIHELLHLIFSKFVEKTLYTGLSIIEYYNVEEGSIFLDYDQIKFSYVNEAITEKIAHDIYEEIYNERAQFIEIVDGQSLNHCSRYYLGIITMNMLSYKIMPEIQQMYKTNNTKKFIDQLEEKLCVSIDLFEIYLSKIACVKNEKKAQMALCSTIDLVNEIMYKLTIKNLDEEEEKKATAYFTLQLENEYFICSYSNLLKWKNEMKNSKN